MTWLKIRESPSSRSREEGFPEFTIEALESVTKRQGEDYLAFVRRAAENPIGRKVKLVDLRDNMDLSRIAHLSEKDLARIKKYHGALSLLAGHPNQ